MRVRHGFTLMEMIVLVSILVVLAAALTPALVGTIDAARRDRALALLTDIEDGVRGFEGDVGEAPPDLTALLEKPANNSLSGCGNTLTGGALNGWAGPYLDRLLPAGGLPVAVGTAQDTLILLDTGMIEYMQTPIPDAEETDAAALDRAVDDGDGSAAGTIRWTAPGADGIVTLYYLTEVDCPG